MKTFANIFAIGGTTGAVLSAFVFLPLVAIGWVFNVLALIGMSETTGALTAGVTIEGGLRAVGLFVFPLGAILGWFA